MNACFVLCFSRSSSTHIGTRTGQVDIAISLALIPPDTLFLFSILMSQGVHTAATFEIVSDGDSSTISALLSSSFQALTCVCRHCCTQILFNSLGKSQPWLRIKTYKSRYTPFRVQNIMPFAKILTLEGTYASPLFVACVRNTPLQLTLRLPSILPGTPRSRYFRQTRQNPKM